MKKSLIAGAGVVALAMAAMPFAGVFAEGGSVGNNGSLKDTLDLTIEDNCVFSRQSTPHTGSSWTTSGQDDDVFESDVLNGQTYDAIATSNFNVVCNNVKGYQVTVATTGFTAQTITGADAWNYNAGGYADGGSSWYLDSNHAGKSLTGANNIVAKTQSATSTTGEDFTITYNAKVSTSQQADTYEATATYTFAELQ